MCSQKSNQWLRIVFTNNGKKIIETQRQTILIENEMKIETKTI